MIGHALRVLLAAAAIAVCGHSSHAESIQRVDDVPLERSAAPGDDRRQGDMIMTDLNLSIALKRTEVLSGEDFAVEVTVRNVASAPTPAPAMGEGGAFVIRLTPEGGGDALAASRSGYLMALNPEDQLERTGPTTEPLGLDETRSYTLYPARLLSGPIAPGTYAVSAAFEGEGGGPVSAPARLDVEARNVVAYDLLMQNALAGGHLAFVHDGGTGSALYQADALAENPLFGAAGRVAALDGPVQIAQALRGNPDPGAAWSAWLTEDGRLAAAISYITFLAGAVAPIDTGLSPADLHPIGWHDAETDARAIFAVLGMGGVGPELALVRLDADAGWSASVARTPLALPGMPAQWRLIPRADGGHVLVAAMAAGDATTVHAIDIGPDGAASAPRLLSEAPLPLAAISVPRMAGDGAMVHLLFGPQITDRARMVFRRVPLAGGDPSELVFRVPMEGGVAPSGWALADGAPEVSVMAAWLAPRLLGLTIGAGSEGGVLRSDVEGGADLSVIASGDGAWAIWRGQGGAIESHRFP
jgi:hypothetical protein